MGWFTGWVKFGDVILRVEKHLVKTGGDGRRANDWPLGGGGGRCKDLRHPS